MDQCIILVGGKGTRLGELTRNFPKPMIEVNGKPFLLYILDYVQRFGFKEIILLSSHGSEYLQDYFKDFKYKNCNITILKEEIPLGTGGALVNSYEYLDDAFFCLNGDSIVEGNWLSIIQDFDETCDCAVALTKVDDPKRYGTVKLENSLIKKFYEKKESDKSQFINAGIYIFRKKIFKNYKKEFISLEKDILPALAEGQKIKGRYVEGYFIDIGTPTSLEEGMGRKWGDEKKAVIFDRDGTLNEDDGYTYKTSDLKWKKGAIDLIKYCNDKNFYVFVATNQSGIAKNKFKESDMHKFHDEMQKQLKKYGAHIDKFYFSPYHVDSLLPEYKKDSKYRKPNVGMLQQIQNEWALSNKNMTMIGDRETDVQCAQNFKIKGFLYNGKDNLFDTYMGKIFE